MIPGADDVIIPNLKNDTKGSEEEVSSQNALSIFALNGLRTLVFAKVELNDKIKFKDWLYRYKKYSIAHDREKQLEKLAIEIEKDLTLIGITAIEDKLQEGVPETIIKLCKAGIKVWMLTGDKPETAQNIGFACKLLSNEM